ncbi:MAG: LPS export ABC transporter periplasmic protein LptC [Methylococcales bacterium]
MSPGQYKVYFVLLFLALGSWFLADFFKPKETVKVKVKDHSPDYFSTGYYKKEMDKTGLLKSELVADNMIHYSDDKTTHLENPVMTLYNPGVPPWVIKSERAIIEADKDHMQLLGKVFISRAEAKNLSQFKLNTSELKVKLSTSYATTHKWGEIIDGQNRTQGVGLQMTFKQPIKIKFLSHVKGRYVFH